MLLVLLPAFGSLVAPLSVATDAVFDRCVPLSTVESSVTCTVNTLFAPAASVPDVAQVTT